MDLTKLVDQFHGVFIDHEVQNEELVNRVHQFFPDHKIKWVQAPPFLDQLGDRSAKTFSESKRWLYITHYNGNFFKRCPGFKPGLACCNYFVLNLGLQCHMDCSYCYLQSYHNSPYTTIYSNIDQAISELNQLSDENPYLSCRVGTGETMDSLGFDPITLFSEKLFSFFYTHPLWYLELKTKTNHVDHLLQIPHKKNIVVSWSLNPQFIIDCEEHGTASLIERLEAAQKCVQHGFLVAFYFDPLIWYQDWEKGYSEVVDMIVKRFDPIQVIQLAMGSLRFPVSQKAIIRERFGMKSLVASAELFQSQTGKLRYDQKIRNMMFQHLIQSFKKDDPRWQISLCMETSQSWKENYQETPLKIPELKPFFQPVLFQ